MPRKKKLNVTVMSFRYPKSIKEKLQAIADKERRSLTDQIIYALENWLEQRKPR
jgi:predicted transcriptional regulator